MMATAFCNLLNLPGIAGNNEAKRMERGMVFVAAPVLVVFGQAEGSVVACKHGLSREGLDFELLRWLCVRIPWSCKVL